MGIPFEAIQNIPIDVAIAMLVDERPNNTRPKPPKNSKVQKLKLQPQRPPKLQPSVDTPNQRHKR
jgi:hypothetical protein